MIAWLMLADSLGPVAERLMTLWLIGWGVRAILIGLILGGLYWLFKRS